MQFCFSFNYYDSKTTAIQNDAFAVADLGEGAQGGPGNPLFLDQTEAQRAEKSFWRLFFFSIRPTYPISGNAFHAKGRKRGFLAFSSLVVLLLSLLLSAALVLIQDPSASNACDST